MILSLLPWVCGVITLVLLAVMATAFWIDPARGLALTAHKTEMLPRVMADRYTAFAMLAVVVLVYGDPVLFAAFFGVCAFMGLADGWIYARAGLAHAKHTFSGVLSVVALGVTLLSVVYEKGF